MGAAAALIGTALFAAGTAGSATADSTTGSTVNVTVNAGEGLGTVPTTGYGLNSAIWDSQMNVPEVQDLIKSANIGMLRYPGGSYGDIYHWKDNTAPGGYVAPGTDFDSFMGTVKKTGAQPILIANYGSGTPQEAADWVRYANITKGYGAKYWEIGNELYGNGHYGSGWETDDHSDTSPTAYANNVVDYSDAMKAVDPSVQIGAVLTMPGNWPDGVMAGSETKDWNHTVLPIIAHKADFVIVHWYPGGSDAASMLNDPSQLAGELSALHDELAAAGVPDMPIALTELNSNVDEDTQPDALFAADSYMTALENGVFTADWWDTHNGAGTISTAPDGAVDYQDYGVLSSGQCVGSTCEPALNTPFPTYHAISMLSSLAKPGDQLVNSASDSQLVAVHAAHQADGDLSVMLINKDPKHSYPVSLHYAGYTPDGSTPTVTTYQDEASAIDPATPAGTSGSQTLPPYSITTVTLHPKAGTTSAVTAPTGTSATSVTDSTATINWSASTGGSVDRYEVYRQNGTTSELLGSSTGSSTTLHNLVPGTHYTLNVQARDSSGKLSRPSAPIDFTTTSPADSTCQVDFQVTAGWGNGYNANVTVTDTGPAPIDGWTLAFKFPSTGESISGFWNANVTTSGTQVIATPVDWNSKLAANGGNSESFGFTGANTGAAPPPTVFTLNGTVCTTV
jgi:hypothetical protein